MCTGPARALARAWASSKNSGLGCVSARPGNSTLRAPKVAGRRQVAVKQQKRTHATRSFRTAFKCIVCLYYKRYRTLQPPVSSAREVLRWPLAPCPAQRRGSLCRITTHKSLHSSFQTQCTMISRANSIRLPAALLCLCAMSALGRQMRQWDGDSPSPEPPGGIGVDNT